MLKFLAIVVLCLAITGCSAGGGYVLPPDRFERTKAEVCSGNVDWGNDTSLDEFAGTGICGETVNVTVTNSKAGFRAQHYIEIHNNPLVSEKFYSEVDPSTMTDFAPLAGSLYENSIDNVLSIEPAYLKPVSYNTSNKHLILDGFASTDKILFIVEYYQGEPALFTISYQTPTELKTGYSMPPSELVNWIDIPIPQVSVNPFITKAVPIVLTVPDNIKLDSNKFEFWIVAETSKIATILIGEQLASSTITKKYAQRWLVELN